MKYVRACNCWCRGYGGQGAEAGVLRHGVYFTRKLPGRPYHSLDSTRGTGVFRRFVRLDMEKR